MGRGLGVLVVVLLHGTDVHRIALQPPTDQHDHTCHWSLVLATCYAAQYRHLRLLCMALQLKLGSAEEEEGWIVQCAR